jgi:hypothetical protein
MASDFLAQFLGNQNRARVVRVFVFAPTEVFTVSLAAKRAGISIASATKEIKVFEKMGVLNKGKTIVETVKRAKTKKKTSGSQKMQTWQFNENFKHARALSSFVHEVTPMQYKSIIDTLKRSGRLAAVILSGSFLGDPTRPADIIIVAEPLYEKRLEQAIKVLEPLFGREIRYAAFSTPEFRYRLTIQDRLIRDTMDYPHLVLLDKARLL